MSDRLIERRDGSGTMHDFYGNDSSSSHMPEKCRACEYDRLKHSLLPQMLDALKELLRVEPSDPGHVTTLSAQHNARRVIILAGRFL